MKNYKTIWRQYGAHNHDYAVAPQYLNTKSWWNAYAEM